MVCWRSTRNMPLLSELNHLFRCGSTEISLLTELPTSGTLCQGNVPYPLRFMESLALPCLAAGRSSSRAGCVQEQGFAPFAHPISPFRGALFFFPSSFGRHGGGVGVPMFATLFGFGEEFLDGPGILPFQGELEFLQVLDKDAQHAA